MTVQLPDFSALPLHLSLYRGTSEKHTIYCNGERFLLKLDHTRGSRSNDRHKLTGESNDHAAVNEYLGTHIFAASGIPTQETILGTYRGKTVVACRDFLQDYPQNYLLLHFRQLEISMPHESRPPKARTEWEFVRHVIRDSPHLSAYREQRLHRFHQMVCMDALIGNADRTSRDWGFITDEIPTIQSLAPVYDCDSSFPLPVIEQTMRELLNNPQLLHQVNADSPFMTMSVNHQRMSFSSFLLSTEGKEFRAVLPALYETLTPQVLTQIVADTPGISHLLQDYYASTLLCRREVVWKPAYELALQEQEEKN